MRKETDNILEIEKFSKSYDKTIIKCSTNDNTAPDEYVRIVQLIYDPSKIREPKVLAKVAERNPSPKATKDVGLNKGKTMFTCIVDEEDIAKPKYTWTDGKLRNVIDDDVPNGKKKYKCKIIPKGTKKIKRMSKDMKKITKTIRKFSKTLLEMSSATNDN